MKKINVRGRWVNMLSRCEDDDHAQYKDYGGRGIYVCDEWHNFNKFYEWCIKNNIKKGLQLDRINNDGPYAPENCSFVTASVNARNKRNTKMLTAFEETKCMSDWLNDDRCVVKFGTLQRRISLGWDHEKAIMTQPNATRAGKNAHNAEKYHAFGQSKLLKEWTLEYPVKKGTFHWRLKNGWTVEQALTGNKRLASEK